MNPDIEAQLEDTLRRQVRHMQDHKEAVQDENGNIPAALKAESDQFMAEAKGLLEIFVHHAREHRERASDQRCCQLDPACTGPEVMLSISVASEALGAHFLGAATIAIGRLAALAPEEEVDPRAR